MICDMRGRINKYFPRGNLCSGFPLHEVIPQQSYDWLSHSASATSVKAPAPPPSFTPLFPTCLAPSAPRFPVPSGRRQKIRLPPVGLQWIFAQVSAKRDNTHSHTNTHSHSHTHTSYIHAYLALYIAAWASPVATLDFGMRFA